MACGCHAFIRQDKLDSPAVRYTSVDSHVDIEEPIPLSAFPFQFSSHASWMCTVSTKTFRCRLSLQFDVFFVGYPRMLCLQVSCRQGESVSQLR